MTKNGVGGTHARDGTGLFRSVDDVVARHRVDAWRRSIYCNVAGLGGAGVTGGVGLGGADGLGTFTHSADVIGGQGIAPAASTMDPEYCRAIYLCGANVAGQGESDTGVGLPAAADDTGLFRRIDGVVTGHGVDNRRAGCHGISTSVAAIATPATAARHHQNTGEGQRAPKPDGACCRNEAGNAFSYWGSRVRVAKKGRERGVELRKHHVGS